MTAKKSRLKSAPSVVAQTVDFVSTTSLFEFTESLIENVRELGRDRTAETYTVSLNSFRRFRRSKDVPLSEIDSDLVEAYQAYLKQCGTSPNTSSFYMRNLRAIYNRAVEKDLVVQRFPFRHVYTGVDKTIKRAIPLTAIQKIKQLSLQPNSSVELARDIFLFSFYTRGMAFVDIAHLKKRDLRNGVLTYRRRKTGQQLSIKWEECMQAIVDKYQDRCSPFLLPLIDKNDDTARAQYLCKSHNINRNLKSIGQKVGLSIPLTMYVARHAWASIAHSKNIPLSVISEGMGHDSEMTTRIYLASLDNSVIDQANSIILSSL